MKVLRPARENKVKEMRMRGIATEGGKEQGCKRRVLEGLIIN